MSKLKEIYYSEMAIPASRVREKITEKKLVFQKKLEELKEFALNNMEKYIDIAIESFLNNSEPEIGYLKMDDFNTQMDDDSETIEINYSCEYDYPAKLVLTYEEAVSAKVTELENEIKKIIEQKYSDVGYSDIQLDISLDELVLAFDITLVMDKEDLPKK